MSTIKYKEQYLLSNKITGSPDYPFITPALSICFNINNNLLYILDGYNKVVHVYNKAGVFQFVFSYTFTAPIGIVCDSYGYVYISDRLDNNIKKFTSDGILVSTFGSAGTGDGQFSQVYRIAIDLNDNIYAIDKENHRVQKFDTDGNFLMKFGHEGYWDIDGFQNIVGISVNSFGDIYVVDSERHCIFIFSSDGTYKDKFGSYGSNVGQFIQPESIAIDKDNKVYVIEYVNERIQVFNNYNVFLFIINSTTDIQEYNVKTSDRFWGICIDNHYNIWVSTIDIDNPVNLITYNKEQLIDNYVSSIIKQLPYGVAWANKFYKSSSLYSSFVKSVAYSIRDLDNRIKALLTSINLYKSTDYLSEWEKLLGLPKEDFDIADSIEQRKLNVLALIRASKAYTLQDWKDIALIMDTEIDVISYLDSYYRSFPFTFNIMFPIENASEKPYYYYVIFKNTTTSGSELSLPYTLPVTLSTSKYQYLEKIYNLIKPAYIKLIFKYE